MYSDPSLQGHFSELYQKEINLNIQTESHHFEDLVMLRIFKANQDWKI